jgi:tetratricopeptide (TPR) repeat protein
VFWIHASNAARIDQGYGEIAAQVKVHSRGESKADIFQLVDKWLRDESKGKWVLIVDNIDDASVLFKSDDTGQQSSLANLLQSRHGSILFTTRTKSVASRLAEENDIILVEPMNETDALMLLENKLGKQMNENDVVELAATLEFMPLAIVQAAAYIRQRDPRYSVRQYVEDFHKNDRKKTSLLNHEAGHLRRDREAKNSIIITWQISFDHIRHIRPSAADLLSLMSFFDRQGIPEAVLKIRNEAKNEIVKESDDDMNDDEMVSSDSSVEDEFEMDIVILRNYSFINVTDRTTFAMHRLVQLAIKKWLKANNQLEKWKQQYIKNLYTVFPLTGEIENWTQCQALLPHAKSVIDQMPTAESSLEEWASILVRAGWYTLETGSYVEAETMVLKATHIRKKLLGEEHPYTLKSMHLLACVYHLEGKWKEAEELGNQVMKTAKEVLGAEHRGSLTIRSNLALIYAAQGRYTEAEELQMQVMKMSTKLLGAKHLNTLASMNNLGTTWFRLGRLNEAEKLQMQVMKMSTKLLGAEDSNTLISMSNLALTYTHQGRLNEAEELQMREMKIYTKVLGADHLNTLISMSNLALVYTHQGRWNEGESLAREAMETQQRHLGTDHPFTLISMRILAFNLKHQGLRLEALSLLEQCGELHKRKLGPQHPDTVSTLEALNSWQMETKTRESESASPRKLKVAIKTLFHHKRHVLSYRNKNKSSAL